MKHFLRFTAIALAVILLSSCSLEELTETTEITISNPSAASVDVTCLYFANTATITIPAYGTVTAEVYFLDKDTSMTLYTDGRFYSSYNPEVNFISSNLSFSLEPNVSWLAVHNSTESTLDFVAFKTSLSETGNYCLYDANGKLSSLVSAALSSGETGYIRFAKSSDECGKTGMITCNINSVRYVSTESVLSPSAGRESNLYLYSSSLKTV